MPEITLTPVFADDFEDLLALRIAAMRDSLERLGRFDPQRARERFKAGFAPEHTRHILHQEQRAGFVAVKPTEDGLLLDHLYIHPAHQGRGLGGAVLKLVFAQADTAGANLHVGALRGSDSNRFYLRHGFQFVNESEWDIYYLRQPTR